jgi:hypothetical protein
MRTRIVMVTAVLLVALTSLGASGSDLGIFGILEKVVCEPDEAHAERVQLWGVFGYTNRAKSVTSVERGYLYFRIPNRDEVNDSEITATLVRREWADLKKMAGTGQAVGWTVFGANGRASVTPGAAGSSDAAFTPANTAPISLRVRPASEPPTSPALYRIDTGVTKISATGTHAELVKQLQEALRK